MPAEPVFSLAGLKLPLNSPRQRINGHATGGILGYDDATTVSDPFLDSKYDRRLKRTPSGNSIRSGAPLFVVVRFLKYAVVLLVVFGIWFVWRYELHVELQLNSRGWIRKEVLPVPRSTSTCFNHEQIIQTDYNLTLARHPKLVELQAGLSTQLGDDCYNFAASIPRLPTPAMQIPAHTIFHTYWRADLLPLSSRHVSLLNSILAVQDSQSTSVVLWTNADTTTHLKTSPLLVPLLNRYGERLRVETVNKRYLAMGTPMYSSSYLDLSDKKAWLDGDLVRLLVLWSRGGIWVDMDTIMTGRDVRPLQEHEWVTQWDCYDKPYQKLNGALMHFFKHSPFVCEMLHEMATDKPPRPASTDWGAQLYLKTWRSLVARGIAPFKILPWCFADGHSCRLDNRIPDPFAGFEWTWGQGRYDSLKRKLDSVWAVHLHNRWDKTFPRNGWVRKLVLRDLEERVKKYQPTPLNVARSSSATGSPNSGSTGGRRTGRR